ncbi:MAG: bifunctional metallophosphatase/5'-nucleotidase [Prevotellaceae bacterium]|jgi:2',3'-cyclic-nucleotide 2'-phosphodiesterase/3'-nucleotidase|nr:bifunctional metallophosphatase/5'-nucleotidase [Prevotellaceae bacterium]
MKRLLLTILCIILSIAVWSQDKAVDITILQTSDIHGAFFPYDFIGNKPLNGSMARVSTIVKSERERNPNLILLDNGDILQGQPSVYYYNFIDTTTKHLYLRIAEYLKYDAAGVGNHDIETGHPVYDRIVRESKRPILTANAVRSDNGKPYFEPYAVIDRDGIKVAVIGLITPAIPKWLPENIWEGMRFEDMQESAAKWIKIVKEKENPQVILGLFHAGHNYEYSGENEHTPKNENASLLVAKNVPGFDAVFIGHDHDRYINTIVNVAGDSVIILDPSNNGKYVSELSVNLTLEKGELKSKKVSGHLIDTKDVNIDAEFMREFAEDYKKVEEFVSRQVGILTHSISSRPAFFGPSEFIDLIHRIQLDITGADISFTAPLSMDTEIKAGPIYVSDMFKLYRFENLLYTMALTGKEIDGFLEHSYAIWTNQMKSEDDHLLLLRQDENMRNGRLVNPFYNFDSAAGIIYTVDVSKPAGDRVTIAAMYDGTPFLEDKIYKVAINSYRGNGGGEHLSEGAGIVKEEISKRIISSTDRDLRYYLMRWIEQQGGVTPSLLLSEPEWSFIPTEWAIPAAKKDYKLLFGE